MNAPCLGCKERHPACHDSCEKYKVWMCEEKKRKDHVKGACMNEFDMMHLDHIYKAKRRYNLQ